MIQIFGEKGIHFNFVLYFSLISRNMFEKNSSDDMNVVFLQNDSEKYSLDD